MAKRSTCLLILLLLLAVGPSYASPVDETDTGLKATEAAEEGQPNVPASNVWGLMLMMTLVLTASTVALLGGGLNQRRAHQFSNSMRSNGIEFQPAEPEPEPAKNVAVREKTRSSGKRRSRPRIDPEQRQLGRKSWHLSRRQNTHGRPGGRRSGPGCRGVR